MASSSYGSSDISTHKPVERGDNREDLKTDILVKGDTPKEIFEYSVKRFIKSDMFFTCLPLFAMLLR